MGFFADAEKAWIDAGGPAALAPTMAAIAAAESGSGTQVYGDKGYYAPDPSAPTSFGWWQIHTFNTNGAVNVQPDGTPYDNARLASDPAYNAQAAVNIWKSQGLNAWTTYGHGHGTFLAHLQDAISNGTSTAVASGLGSGTASGAGGSSSSSSAPSTFAPVALGSQTSTLIIVVAALVLLIGVYSMTRRSDAPKAPAPVLVPV